jgi:small subunit ribosomal protein S17
MKIFDGPVISVGMQNTIVVEVTRRVPHPLYKKLIKKSSKFKADTNGIEVSVGDVVRIQETRPISKGKFFKVAQKLTAKEAGKAPVKKVEENLATEPEAKEEKKPVKKAAKKESPSRVNK